MKTTFRSTLLLFLAFALAIGTATAQKKQGPTKNPFLWIIEGKGDDNRAAKSYLFGTMHLGDDRLTTIHPEVEKARNGADALYCELALDQMMKQQMKLTRMMLAPKGERLSDVLPKDVYKMLDKKFESLGMSIDRMNNFRVWAVGILLSQLEAQKLGMLQSLDQKLYMEAKNDDKEVGGLETMDEQMKAISAGTNEEHAARLRESLQHMAKLEAEGKNALAMMLDVYLTGNEVKLLDFVEESMGDDDELNEKFMRPMLDERNKRMANRIDEMLTKDKDKKYFFAIGAMHYVGETGVGTLLRKKGWRIKRVAAPKASWKDIVEMREEISKLRKKVRKLEKKLEGKK